MAKKTVPVSKRALLQRINRALRSQDADGGMVKATRGDRWRDELGDYYRIDIGTNAIVEKRVDLEEIGRELEVLKPYEHLADD